MKHILTETSVSDDDRPGKHILIVDDYADALDIWAIYLRRWAIASRPPPTAPSAIAQAERLLPDLIVLDLELPGISGFDVARRLRADPETQHIPLIAATGYSHLRQLDRAREVGFDRIVVKPCDPDVLVEEIERLLPTAGRADPAQPCGCGTIVTRMGSDLPTGGANDYRYCCD